MVYDFSYQYFKLRRKETHFFRERKRENKILKNNKFQKGRKINVSGRIDNGLIVES